MQVDLGLLEKRPSYEAYVQRCFERPAYQRAQAVNQRVMVEHKVGQ